MTTQLPEFIKFIQRGWVNANMIVVLGEGGPVVVDTGDFRYVDETLQLIEAEGVDLAEIQLIVNTHCHWDHFGANEAIRKLSGAPLATSAKTAVIFEKPDRKAMWLDYFGIDVAPQTVDIRWQDGDVVSLAGVPFQVIATPGHAPDGIALFQPETRLLISADALHENDCGILNTAVHGESVLDDALTTLARLRELDAQIALPGHGNIITDVPANLDALERRLHRFKDDPVQMALHLLRRVMMAGLLMNQPLPRDAMLDFCLKRPWPYDYAPRVGADDPEKLLNCLLDEFIERSLVSETDAGLTSFVPI